MSSKLVKKSLAFVTSLSILLSNIPASLVLAKEVDNIPTRKEYSRSYSGECVLSVAEFEELLEEDPKLRGQHEKLLQEGYEFIDAEEYYVSDGITRAATGKIVQTNYKQPVKREVVYSESWYNGVSALNNPLQVIIGHIKYVWIPITLFGISTSDFTDYYSTGRNEILIDGNLHVKTAYHYDADKDKYWHGYEAQKFVEAVTVTCVYKAANGDPYHESESNSYTYYSPNYNSDSYLLRMADLYWNGDYMWEPYERPDTQYIN